MISSRTRLSPLLRSLAAVMLLVWVTAFMACSTKCFCADSDSEHAEQASATNNHSPGSDKDCDHEDCDHDDSFCTSLHSLTPVSTTTVLDKPDFGLAFTLDFLSTAQLVTAAQTETSVSRQQPDRQFVFTPEVSLGAASRSLAPPVLL